MPGKPVSKLKKELSAEELLAQLERRRGTFFEHLVHDDADSDFVDRLLTRARGMLSEGGSNSAQTEVGSSNTKEVAADFTSAEKDLREAVLSDEILSAINTLGGMLPEAGRPQFIEKTIRNAAEALCAPSAPEQDQAPVQAAAEEALAKVKDDATLLRQWQVYQRLLTTVKLPPNGLFETLEQAADAAKLAYNYSSARKRQAKLGIELVPENDKYIKQVASAASWSYQKLKPKAAELVA